MRKFIIKIFYFFFPFIILSYPLDYAISYFLSKSNQTVGEFEVMDDIYNSKANCDIAIYGSSRAWVHIDPKIISDSLTRTAYNFGNDGHTFDLQYLRHLEFLKYNKKPATIILSVDIFSLQKVGGLYEADQYLPYMLWNDNYLKYTKSYNYYTNLEYYIPMIRYIGKIDVLKTSIQYLINGIPVNNYRHNGFLGMDRVWNTDFDKVKSKQKTYRVKLNKQHIQLLETFIKECKELEINLILVYTPEYKEGQDFVANRKEVIDVYNKFSKKYNLKFYDYSNDEICLDKTLFYNASHLNSKGAEMFTKKFASVLKSII
ncbi:hypothetical protein [Flavobacterium reichenbachii]|uniref:Uncharacterized protein n=1 Tax=Flavobacterium reichenbachii TaxID=362418 RepID=A0A085ZK54_9FLAO|nr:hypothetical protein [Flavobacterium reichenbachii]KFF04818.1 hypothetical protein IW19_04390 [Flavobacterium reichenbachii]OXB10284.1 hypothetical protein B0A68_22075 [Flavobacterium reichenbachii]